MKNTHKTESQFRNSHGEIWQFKFDSATGIATVSGSDVDWQRYPVVDGNAVGLSLSPDEITWLRSTWVEICADHPCTSLYVGRETVFKENSKFSFLTNSFCPLCLIQKREFEIHHCIAATHGGPDTPSNLLYICNSCHALITRGSIEDRVPKEKAALNHQLMHFGIRLFQDALARPNKRTGNSFLDQNHFAPKIMEHLSQASPEMIANVDIKIKQSARVEYQYLRDIGLGKWSWLEYEERFLMQQEEPE